MENQTEQTSLIPYNGMPAQRKSFLGRLFSGDNGQERSEMQQLTHEHALARRAIQLDADLARCRRQAAHFLEITAFEDKAIAAITSQQKLDDLCEQVNELFADDPMTGLVLNARIKEIYRGSKHGVGRNRKR